MWLYFKGSYSQTTIEIKKLHFVVKELKITTYKSSKFNKNNKVSF
ncbi:hypothetical protein J532_1379 [Acinetobacter baumannii 940793]|nr:hypothetical protein J516_3194 [Acinetobacter baumannii 1406750]EXB55762.1 hypothetical protein J548_3682 [Acinetobacter baumannii 1465485]EXD89415.1 hypothetical protein J454_0489 [Acinetobacter baumannii 993520]EXG74503.1 hypothetical protein J652_3234 [Acinetobacter baumannii 1296252]EXR24038.1 hypothetical protein J657_3426 [Acinetobacter baumannii 1266220]EXR38355.1 hypothetical protein J664_3411 [Acinetobacter baumannii 1294222]EXS09734.1 hypothetical protein J654_3302 [Acinetobacter